MNIPNFQTVTDPLIYFYVSLQNIMHTAKQNKQKVFVRITSYFQRRPFNLFHGFKMSMARDFIIGNSRIWALRLPWPGYGRRGTRTEESSGWLCGVYHSIQSSQTKGPTKPWSLYKRKQSPLEIRNRRKCVYHKGTWPDKMFESAHCRRCRTYV